MSEERETVTCTECGWVHFLLTREEAQRSIDDFNEFSKTLDRQQFLDYYGGRTASMADYERCFRCGGSGPMRESLPGDCPDGCTIQPTVLGPEE